MELTSESVLALAPDASSVKAAQALLKPGQWPTLGFNENAVWGECKGSGSKPYQVEADLSGPVFKCTCPSRKFPCKHSLALLLLRVQQEAAFTQGEAPDWVKEWLDAREKRAARQEQKQENKGQPADPAAKREASRLKRMAAGLDDLERWMCDLIRHGLGQLSGTPAWQEEAAARMVDAQLPGIAARLRNLQGVTSSGEDWPGVVLAQFGQLQLLIDAFRHLDALSPEEQADVRAALGLSPDKDEVLATGERLSDLWLVLGVGYAEENRLWRRRVWLRGQAKTAPIPTVSLHEALEGMAKAIAAQPWQWPLPLMVSDGVPCRSDDSWFLQTDAGDRLPLSITDNDGWELLTQGGGRPLSVWGEWDGARFQPLSAWEPGTSGSPLWREGARP